jgi:putative endonuclease
MSTDGATGRHAEELAVAFLTRKGYRLLTRNYHCRRGEIDVVMIDGSTLVFVEVRCRSAGQRTALESITWTKRHRIQLAAQQFLAYQRMDMPCRFDVVIVCGTPTAGNARISHFPAAFQLGE